MILPALIGAISGAVSADAGVWVPLASTTLGTSANEVTFTSAGSASPWSDFEDLILIARLRNTNTDNNLRFQINNDSGSGSYTETSWTCSNGSTPSVGGGTGNTYGKWDRAATDSGDSAESFSNSAIRFASINDTTFKLAYQTLASYISDSAGKLVVGGGNWVGGSAAMTELDITNPSAGHIAAGSALSLFGLKAVV